MINTSDIKKPTLKQFEYTARTITPDTFRKNSLEKTGGHLNQNSVRISSNNVI